MGGRNLQGGGGIRPDITITDTLSAGEQAFGRELGSDIPEYWNAMTTFSREIQGDEAVKEPDFPVTDALLLRFRESLRERGIELSDSAWAGGRDILSRQLSYDIVRYSFGRAEELRRRAVDDAYIHRAAELLSQATSSSELMALAGQSN